MKIRKLKLADAVFMHEWMKDYNVVKNLSNNFGNMTQEDCIQFIEKSMGDETHNIHYAIADDKDEYCGTISLKNIDYKNRNAEYAIVVRSKYFGTGIAKFATQEILKVAFEELGLNKVYLCVMKENERAIKFYKKYGFIEEGQFRNHIIDIHGNYQDLLWFGIINSY